MLNVCQECGHKQSANHLECEKCGSLLNEDTHIICGTCGLSNQASAKTCIGCKSVLEKDQKHILYNTDTKTQDLDSKSLFFEGIKNNFKKISKKAWLIIGGVLAFLILVIIGLVIIFGDSLYIKAESGFYYLSQNKELVIIDEKGDKSTLLTGVDSVDQVRKFKRKVYFIADNNLYLHEKNKLKTLAENVHSYQLDLKADQVLYTVFIETTGFGDLYLYDGKKHTRIDGNVGHKRYIFSNDQESIYYVKDITEEEMLGTLYYKKGSSAPVAVADDVYTPLISLKNDTCYFSRKDTEAVEKFELYYLKQRQIIEIDRHVKHMLVHPKEDQVYLMLYKNDQMDLAKTQGGNIDEIANDIQAFGQYQYGDLTMGLNYLEPYFFFYMDSGHNNYYVDEKETIELNQAFEDYWFSKDEKVIYIKNQVDWDVYDFKAGTLKDGYNIGTMSELLNISSDGKYGILRKHTGDIVLTNKGKEVDLPKDGINFDFTEDDKFYMYLEKGDFYVHKINAKEPVFLSDQMLSYVSLDDKIFIFEPRQVHAYELGKYKSKKQIDTYVYWSFFN